MKAFFERKKKSKLLVLPPSTPYKMSQVEEKKKKKNFTKPKLAIFEISCVHSSKAEDCTFFLATCCVLFLKSS